MINKSGRWVHLLLAAIIVFAATMGLFYNKVNAASPDLFISEYIEGNSFNKAIEIFNGTGHDVDLAASGYCIKMYFNGSKTANESSTVKLTGVVKAGDVYVVANDGDGVEKYVPAKLAIQAQADLITKASWFNGNDAVVLMKGTTVIDCIGKVGENPGTAWVGRGVSTYLQTLVRKPEVTEGDTNPDDYFDPSLQWLSYPVDTSTYLGWHTAKIYTVTFKPGAHGSLSTSAPAVQYINDGKEATAPGVIPVDGYNFTNWDTAFNNVTGDLTVTAQYDNKVTFKPGAHGSLSSSAPAVQYIKYGSAAVDPGVIPVDGYSFTKWDASFNNVTGDLTVTAQYAIKTYSVTFEPGAHGSLSSSGAPAVQTIDYGFGATAPDAIPVDGYSFTKWDASFSKVTGDLTVTAQYAIKTYTVTFDLGEHGSFDPKGAQGIQTVNYGLAAAAPTVIPNEGYDFTSWDKSFDNITGELTVTAQYAIKTYKVTFDLGEHGSIDPKGAQGNQTIKYGSAATAPSVIPTEGYSFTSWNATFSNVTGQLTVTALYAIKSYQVTFEPGAHGSLSTSGAPAVQTVNHGSAAAAPSVNPNAGYDFTGWDKTFDQIANNLTVTAQYTIKNYTVTFDLGAHGTLGSGILYQTINHGQSALAPTVVPDTGYNFTGWNAAFNNVTDNLTVTALYAIKSYTVTFAANTTDSVSGMPLLQNWEYNSKNNLPSNTPARLGFTFTSWNTAANGNGLSYREKDLFTMPILGTTLYAQWIPNKYNVTFIAADAIPTASFTADYGTLIDSPTDPVKTNYLFAGWCKESDCINQWDFKADQITKDIKLFANWKVIAAANVKLSFNTIESRVGEIIKLGATVTPIDAYISELKWSSSNPSVAMVDQSGKVTTIKAGQTTISLSIGSFSDTCLINVQKTNLITPATTGTAKPEPSVTSGPTIASEPIEMQTTSNTLDVSASQVTDSITVKIDYSKLPVGTKTIQLLNGDIINVKDKQGIDSLLIEKKDLSADGTLSVIALNDEDIPLGSFDIQNSGIDSIQLSVPANPLNEIFTIVLLILIGVIGIGAIFFVVLKKRHS